MVSPSDYEKFALDAIKHFKGATTFTVALSGRSDLEPLTVALQHCGFSISQSDSSGSDDRVLVTAYYLRAKSRSDRPIRIPKVGLTQSRRTAKTARSGEVESKVVS